VPRIAAEKLVPSQIYGKSKVDNTLTMGERIRKRFKPTDTVKVHNITDTLIEWQWFEEADESYVIEEGSNVKIVERGDPQLWRLGPGEMDILQGSCAYLMIESLYKQMSAMKTGVVLHPLDEREIRNFGFDDPQKQEEVIDLIFRGKVTPQMMQEAAMSSLGGDFKPKVLEHMPKMATEQDEHERRTGAPARRTRTEAPSTPVLNDLAGEFEQENGSDEERDNTGDDQGNDAGDGKKQKADGPAKTGSRSRVPTPAA
jgi:hypothetical protein